jgi:hypothetical protein
MLSANTQASIFLAIVAIAAGPLAAKVFILSRQPWPITVTAAIGGTVLFGAVWLLLDVVFPRLDPSGGGSFQTWSACDRESLKDALAAPYQLDELRVMSRIANAKYKRLRRAGLLLKLDLILLAVGTLLSIVI